MSFGRALFRVIEKIYIFAENIFVMPEISRFYGIIIKMFFKPKEHEPAHIHALYNEYVGIFDIKTFEMIEGDLPIKAQQLVREWLGMHYEELAEMWNTQKMGKITPL